MLLRPGEGGEEPPLRKNRSPRLGWVAPSGLMKMWTSQGSGAAKDGGGPGEETDLARQYSHGSGASGNSGDNRFFMDIEANLRQAMAKTTGGPVDKYKDTGLSQAIARSPIFEQVILVVIALNALWLWIDTDLNSEAVLTQAHWVFQVGEHFFCVVFLGEWLIRILALRRWLDAWKDSWFLFDTVLVIMAVLDTWVLTLFVWITSTGSGLIVNGSMLRVVRLVRLVRIARMARLLRAMPELMIMIRGMFAAMRSVFFTFCLLVLLMYVFAICFTTLTRDSESGSVYFPNVGTAMYNLLIYGTLLDNLGKMANVLADDSFFYVGLLIVFVVLTALTVMNMLIGVLCEVVSAVAAIEKEEMALRTVKEKLQTIVMDIDMDGDMMISKVEFKKLLEFPQARKVLQDVDVDIFGLLDVAHMMFEEDDDDGQSNGQMNLDQFTDAVMQLRGKNVATIKDIMNMRKFVRKDMSVQLEATNSHLAFIEAALREMQPEAVDRVEPEKKECVERKRKRALSMAKSSSMKTGGSSRSVSPGRTGPRLQKSNSQDSGLSADGSSVLRGTLQVEDSTPPNNRTRASSRKRASLPDLLLRSSSDEQLGGKSTSAGIPNNDSTETRGGGSSSCQLMSPESDGSRSCSKQSYTVFTPPSSRSVIKFRTGAADESPPPPIVVTDAAGKRQVDRPAGLPLPLVIADSAEEMLSQRPMVCEMPERPFTERSESAGIASRHVEDLRASADRIEKQVAASLHEFAQLAAMACAWRDPTAGATAAAKPVVMCVNPDRGRASSVTDSRPLRQSEPAWPHSANSTAAETITVPGAVPSPGRAQSRAASLLQPPVHPTLASTLSPVAEGSPCGSGASSTPSGPKCFPASDTGLAELSSAQPKSF